MTEPTDESELEVDFSPEAYTDTLSCPDGEIHFGHDAQTFLLHWVGKLGLEVSGAAVVFGEGCSLAIVHPETGEVLTPKEIAQRVQKSRISRVQ